MSDRHLFGWDYPPGVTGNEPEIAGYPDDDDENPGAPYTVWIYGPWGDQQYEFATFDDALDFAVSARDSGRGGQMTSYRVIGDGYDAEYTTEGPRECSDGLTDEERERCEEVGLI